MVARMRRWLVCAGGVLAVAVARPTEARAEDASPAVRIHCPELSDGELAELEARARVELAMAPFLDRDLDVDCSERRVTAVARAGEGAPVEQRVADAVGGTALVDALLGAVHALLAQVGQGPTAEGGANLATRDPHKEAPPPGPAPTPEPELPDDVAPAPLSPHVRIALTASVDAELWSGSIGPALGGHVGARVSPRPEWAAELTGGVVWGLGTAEGIEGRAFGVVLRVEYAPIAHLRLGLGADARLLVATGSGAMPGQRSGTTLGALALARYALVLGGVEFMVGPEIDVFARPVVVQANGSEAFRLPTVVAGLSIEAAVDLVR
jgi:hypothetical protein